MLWVFKGCGYVIGIQGMWLCYGYLRDVIFYGYLRDVVMLWVFKGCGYAMGI
jgi:hypothetical protein